MTTPAELRNVVLVGSAGSGKSTLFEHLLAARLPGYRSRPEDAERQSTLALASVATGDVVVNLMDAPGHPDFVGDLRAGLRAADAAIFVVAATDGVDPATAQLWRECAEAKLPRAIAVTKLDAERGTFADCLAECQAAFGEGVVPAYVPLEDDGQVVGNLSLVTGHAHDYRSGSRVNRAAEGDEVDQLTEARAPFIETIVTEAEDDELMERYLEGEELAVEAVSADLLASVAHASFFPVIPVLTTNGVGSEELLRLIERGFPAPTLHPLPTAMTASGDDVLELACDPDAALVAEVIRTTSDNFAGRLSMVRVFSGTLRTDDTVAVAGPHHEEPGSDRVGALSFPVGLELKQRPQAIAGDIVLVAKLAHAETSDTLSEAGRPLVVEPWPAPEPQLPLAIRAATRKDEDKLPAALQRLVLEDPTLRLERSAGTDQLVLWTMGQAHADQVMARLRDRLGVNVETDELKVAYRETLAKGFTATGRHVKQSGGHGQYAVCEVTFEPAERGTGFEFVDKVVGGVVPRQFIPSVEKGLRDQLGHGTVYGYPMVDVRATLFDGKAHSVDSSDMAFQTAGALALKEGATTSHVVLLEPVDAIEVTVAQDYLGAVMTDVTARRGQVQGTDAAGDDAVVVKALVPAAELARYAIDLRGLAHGTGSFVREFHGYQPAPESVASAVAKH